MRCRGHSVTDGRCSAVRCVAVDTCSASKARPDDSGSSHGDDTSSAERSGGAVERASEREDGRVSGQERSGVDRSGADRSGADRSIAERTGAERTGA